MADELAITQIAQFTPGTLFYSGKSVHSFRSGERADVLGIVRAVGKYDHLCWHVRYADGVEDYVPIIDYACQVVWQD